MSRVHGSHGVGHAPRVRIYLSEHPGDLSTDDGNILQCKLFRSLNRRIRLVDRKPVHREEGVDVRVRAAGRLVDELFGAGWVTECPQHVAGPQESASGAV